MTATGPTRSGNVCWPTRYDRKTSGVTPDLMITDEDQRGEKLRQVPAVALSDEHRFCD
jgi:hypothetical protein